MSASGVQSPTTERVLPLLLGVLGLIVGAAFAVASFVTTAVAPCDPSLPLLSDGTREAPHPWAYVWASFDLVAGVSCGLGAGLVTRLWAKSGKAVGIGAGVGIGAFIIMWIAGAAFWAKQCPV